MTRANEAIERDGVLNDSIEDGLGDLPPSYNFILDRVLEALGACDEDDFLEVDVIDEDERDSSEEQKRFLGTKTSWSSQET